MSVLYIDDEKAFLDQGKTFLENNGDIAVDTSFSAEEGLYLLNANHYDAIVSDYQMPVMDGIQLLKEVRKGDPHIPFILFTGKGREEVVIEAINNGADFYLQKGGSPKVQFAELEHQIKQSVRREKAEKDVRMNEKRLRQIIDLVPHFIFAKDREGKFILVNKATADAYGTTVEELTNKMDADYARSETEVNHFRADDNEVISSGHPKLIPVEPITDSKGNIRFLSTTKIPFSFSGTASPAVLGVSVDITDRKSAEKELQRSQSLFQTIFRTSPAATIFSRLDNGRCIDANNQYLALVGYTREELVGSSTLDLGIWADPHERGRIVGELAEKKVLSDVEIQIRRKHGEVRDTIASGEIITLDGQQYILSFFFDITKRKNADEALRQSEEKFRALFENQQNGVVIIEPETHTIVDANPAALNMIGMRKEEILGRVCHNVMCPSETGKCPITDLCQEIDNSERVLASKNSGHLPIIKSVKKVRFAGKEYLIESFVSIEDRRNAEEALRKANDQLTLLTSITRHDIINKITAIRGFLELARERSPDQELRDYINRIEVLTGNIRAQIEFTKAYQDIGSHAPCWQRIYDVTSSLSIPSEISFTKDCAPFDLLADPVLQKVFHNLLDNSIRHGDGVTAIRLFCEENEGGLQLVWEDNGVGILSEEKNEIFSRGYGKNTGYGLFLIREILSITGMTIDESGEPGKGARFTIHIPHGMYRKSQEAS